MARPNMCDVKFERMPEENFYPEDLALAPLYENEASVDGQVIPPLITTSSKERVEMSTFANEERGERTKLVDS